jgi:hypothetical protein
MVKLMDVPEEEETDYEQFQLVMRIHELYMLPGEIY